MSEQQHNTRQIHADAAALRKRAEAQARTMEPTISAQTPEEIRQMLHELHVHQIELSMQNEELRFSQAELDASRERYFDLYDLAPVGYCTLSEKGLILEANLTAAILLGMTRSALVKQQISRFILREDQDIFYLHRKKLFKTGEQQECELRLVKQDGAAFWAHLTATTAHDADGDPVCRIVLSDIIERKQAEDKLRDSELFLRTTINALKGHICVLDETGKLVMTNKAWDDFALANNRDLQCVSEGVNYLAVCDCATGPDLESARSFASGIRAVLSGDTQEFSMEYPCHSPSEKRWFLGTVSPLQRKDSRWVVINHDNITGRKQAEENLIIITERLNLALASARVGVWDWNIKTNELIWDDRMLELYGLARENFLAEVKAWEQGLHSDDSARVIEEYQSALRGERDFDTEFRVRHHDGTVIQIKANGLVKRDEEGNPIRMIGLNADITDRKQQEERITLLGRMLDDAPAAITIHETDGRFVFANMETVSMHGYDSIEEFLQVNLHKLDVPASEALLAERFRKIDEEHEARFEVEHYRKDGSTFPLAILAKRIESEGRSAVLSIATDITDRKQAEQKQRQHVEELQRWYAATMGREGRVLELKREVNELLRKAAQPIRYPSADIG